MTPLSIATLYDQDNSESQKELKAIATRRQAAADELDKALAARAHAAHRDSIAGWWEEFNSRRKQPIEAGQTRSIRRPRPI
jgi:hypothetical protein